MKKIKGIIVIGMIGFTFLAIIWQTGEQWPLGGLLLCNIMLLLMGRNIVKFILMEQEEME